MQFILALNKCGKGLETHVCIMQWHKPLVWPSLQTRIWSVAREDFLIYFHYFYYYYNTMACILFYIHWQTNNNNNSVCLVPIQKLFTNIYFVSQGSNIVVKLVCQNASLTKNIIHLQTNNESGKLKCEQCRRSVACTMYNASRLLTHNTNVYAYKFVMAHNIIKPSKTMGNLLQLLFKFIVSILWFNK